MTNDPSALPRVAVFYESPGSFPPFQIRDAARGLCEIYWVVQDLAAVGPVSRLLPRLGTVVDMRGRSASDVAVGLRAAGVSGVVAYSDRPLAAAAEVAEAGGYRFHRPEVAARLQDKVLQRAALQAGGLDVPAFRRVAAAAGDAEREALAATFELPAVVKPARGSGSREARVVHDREALRRSLGAAVDEDFIVEGYLEDPGPAWPGRLDASGEPRCAAFVSVETIAVDGVLRHLFVTGRFPIIAPARETGSFLPSNLDEPTADDVRAVVTSAARALGIEQGFLHTEVKITPAGPRVIEVNGRLGGGIPEIVAGSGGPDLLQWSLLASTGADLPATVPPRQGVAFFSWEQPPEDAVAVDDLAGVSALHSIPGISEVSVRLRPDDPVDWRGGSQCHVFAVSGVVADHDALWRLRREIAETVKVTYRTH